MDATKKPRLSLPPVDHEEPEEHAYDYDMIVIGGGSGGLACSKAAAELGKKVAVCDFVKPSPHGSTWGLGGTCVNVGCIPKKLMHQASLLGDAIKDAKDYGWQVPEGIQHAWEVMVNGVQDYIGSLNWGYRVQLREKSVTYLNAYARFIDPHTIECTTKANKVTTHTARRFVIAIGGRPKYPEFPGALEHCITSDDVFSLQSPPGKTLVIGASYVALECAGFLAGIGFDTTIMVRSILLRGFDQQIAEHLGEVMSRKGIKIIRPAVPLSVELQPDGKKLVTWQNMSPDGGTPSEEFDTVLVATGREACTADLGLELLGVEMDATAKIIADEYDRSTVPHIYAIGDVARGRPELTPVAIAAGRLLSARLYAGSTKPMDYVLVPTTVFTPLEYGCVGLSEEAAVAAYGADNVEVYHAYYQPLEWSLPHRPDNDCYCKLIVHVPDHERVVGLHFVGPNAGEITQGFAVAMKMGATKANFDETVGIHPTIAEEFTKLDITRRSGKDPKKSGC